MAKIYVAFSVEDEDRECVGAFSTREAAEAVVGPDGVEEHELDPPTPLRFGPVYYAAILVNSGQIRSSVYEDQPRHPTDFKVWRLPNAAGGDLVGVHSPISAEHAAQVVREERDRILEARKAEAAVAQTVT